MGLNPIHGLQLLGSNLGLGFAILGSVFLVLTGAEALYADIGHFGKGPIRLAWLAVAFPCLLINYLGQGALVLADPSAAANPFFRMIPAFAYWPLLILTTAATVIASQAVITGAFSVSQQAMQLGLLPRLDIRRTSEAVAGQIFVPQVNTLLMAGVLALLVMFRSSSNLAAAYGIAVTGTMVITVLLLFVIARRRWKWPLAAAVALTAPFLLVDLTFLAANAMKFAEGGWFPVALGGGLVLVMWTWTRGSQALFARSHHDSIDLADLIAMLSRRPPRPTAGTAVFLTSDPEKAPVALTHNLKHNNVLHEQNVILTVRTAETPRVPEAERVKLKRLGPAFTRVVATYGFMEQPNVLKTLADCRPLGLKLDIMSTSFFLGRRTVTPSAHSRLPAWQHRLFVYLMRNAANPTDFFHIPPGRVVELGTQVLI
jgi:KUP system potassium uptake protein